MSSENTETNISVYRIIIEFTTFVGALSLLMSSLHELGYYHYIGLSFISLLSPADFIKNMVYWLPFTIASLYFYPLIIVFYITIASLVDFLYGKISAYELKILTFRIYRMMIGGSEDRAKAAVRLLIRRASIGQISKDIKRSDHVHDMYLRLTFLIYLCDIRVALLVIASFSFVIIFISNISGIIYISGYVIFLAISISLSRLAVFVMPMDAKSTKISSIVFIGILVCPIFYLGGIKNAYHDLNTNQITAIVDASNIQDKSVIVIRTIEKGIIYKQSDRVEFRPWDDVKSVSLRAPGDPSPPLARVIYDNFLHLWDIIAGYFIWIYDWIKSKFYKT